MHARNIGSIVLSLMAMMILATPVMAITQNSDVMPFPSTMNLNVNFTDSFNISFNLLNNMNGITVGNVSMNSTFLKTFSPINVSIPTNVTKAFIANLQILNTSANIIGNTSLNMTDTIKIYGTLINITDNSTISNATQVAYIGLYLNVSTGNIQLYYFKKCFIDQQTEFCSAVNASDLNQIVIVTGNASNVTNVGYNMLVPINLTMELINDSRQNNQQILNAILEAKEAIKNSTDATIAAQQRASNMYRNAFIIETYLKSPTTSAWMQISPTNFLINITGLSETELADAFSVLIQQNKLTQKTEKQTLIIPVGNGEMTQVIDVVSVASSERLLEENIQKQSSDTVIIVMSIAAFIVASVLFYELTWKKRIGNIKSD